MATVEIVKNDYANNPNYPETFSCEFCGRVMQLTGQFALIDHDPAEDFSAVPCCPECLKAYHVKEPFVVGITVYLGEYGVALDLLNTPPMPDDEE